MKIKEFLVVSLIFLLTGCPHTWSHRSTASNDPNGEWVPIAETAAVASRNINKLDRGMSKAEVYSLMGTKTHYDKRGYRQPTTIPHPKKREIIENGGNTYEILYYYSAYKKGNASLTPVILFEDKVIGWGWNYYNRKLK